MKKFKTSILFELPHEVGTLANALKCFGERNLNISCIEKRPIPKKPFKYIFFLDIEGNVKDKKMKEAITELRKLATSFRLLGCYPAGKLPKRIV